MPLVNFLTFGRLFYRLEIVGLENVKNLSGKLIITSNHKSYVDSLLLLSCLPVSSRLLPARAMAADWLFGVPILKWGLKFMGAYRVYKGTGLEISLRDPLRILAKGLAVMIFFEGRANFRTGVDKPKRGLGFLAWYSGAPILPAAIQGAEYLTVKDFFFGNRKFKIVFGTLYYPHNLKKRTYEDIAVEAYEKVVVLYEQN